MALNDDELKYKNVIDTLKGLPKVNAPRNFESDLMRRINSETYKEKQSFWKRLFLPSRLIPSAALAVSAVVLLFILSINNDSENPLLMEPTVREDVIDPGKMLVIYIPVNYNKTKQLNKEEDYSNIADLRKEKTNTPQKSDDNLYLPNDYYLINKNGLNFRQVNLTKEEQQRLNELKEHFKLLLKNSGNN
ncbi:MAG: hypothetical protein A2V93_11525 [Ignavibacteria bacterium RBG_16_34_14]|nr:MAG: hypothetical protein A2V93_11525 [Ignavibacteria bacterium RBG_16_34_14]